MQQALQALKLGSALVTSPSSGVPAAAAAKREAGFILLGAAAAALPRKALQGRAVLELLDCWEPALLTAAAELDAEMYLPVCRTRGRVSCGRSCCKQALRELMLMQGPKRPSLSLGTFAHLRV